MDNPKPLLLNETGKQIVAVLGAIAKNGMTLENSWNAVKDIVASGGATGVFSVGSLLTDKYNDIDNNTSYDFPWHVNDFRNVTLASGDTLPAMILQPQYSAPQSIQFTNIRAFLSCPSGLTKGTYHLTLGETWGNNAVKGKVYQFTLTKDVPKNGRLAGFKYMPDSSPSGWKVYSYLADGITLAETVAVTEGSGGTDLGTMNYATRREVTGIGTMNSMQETAYGHNRWKTSAVRQWLNSDKRKGSWWSPQDEFDIAPDQLATMSGFLTMLPAELVAVLKPVKVTTYTNTVQDGGEADITYDRVFLPSLEEEYINKQISGEGTFHRYWKIRSSATSPVPWYQSNDRYITYGVENKTSAVYNWLRSVYRGNANYAWYVGPSGGVSSSNCTDTFRVAPLICIA